MKYYLFLYRIRDTALDVEHCIDSVTSNHPFQEITAIKKQLKKAPAIITLENWKEITEQEFDLFNKLKQ